METHASAVVQSNASGASPAQPSEHFVAVQAYIEGQDAGLRMLQALLPDKNATSQASEPGARRSALAAPGAEQACQLAGLRKEIQSLSAMLDTRLRVSSLRLETMAFQVQALDDRIGGMQLDRFPDFGSQPRSSWPDPGRADPDRGRAAPRQSRWGASLPGRLLRQGSAAARSPARKKVSMYLGGEEEGPCDPQPESADSCVGLEVEQPDLSTQDERPVKRCAAERFAAYAGRPQGLRGRGTELASVSARDALYSWVNPLQSNKTMFFPDTAAHQRRGRRGPSPALQLCSGLLILLNVVYMIVNVHFSMEAVLQGREAPPELWWGSLAFAAAFTLEIAVRMCFEGKKFVSGKAMPWNVFDSIVVVLQWVDLCEGFVNVSGLRSLRVLRVAPAVRLLRALRYARELRLMVAAIRGSLTSLAWALFLLATVVLFFALALQQTVEVQIESRLSTLNPLLVTYYGSLQRSMLTVFLAISGGADWKELVEPLEELSQSYLVVFALFVAFLLFGLLNILAAIFVEQSCRVRQNSAISHLQDALETVGGDAGGALSAAELEEVLHDPHFVIHLKASSLDASEARGLFQLLDPDRTGCVKVQEFISGLKRITGTARAVDIATMYYENKRTLALVSALVKEIEDKFCGPTSTGAAS